MNDKDWDDFARDGASWSPAGKGRVIILEKDDVLLMPPGLRVLHTVFTLGTSLMEGGIIWDECNIPALLDELLWVAQNQSCTNEAVAYQLPEVIDSLRIWINENGEGLSTRESDPEYVTNAMQGIEKLQNLGCNCPGRCKHNDGCRCKLEDRRCTAWCFKHPAIPDHARSQTHECMHEG